MNNHSEKRYFPDGTILTVKPRWPIPRKTFPDPDRMVAKEKALQEVLRELEDMVGKSSDVDELNQIAELSQIACDVAFWLRKRAEAAAKKLVRETA